MTTTTTRPALTSLAAVKRALQVGARMETVESTAPHARPGEVRTVEIAQGNAIAFRGVWANGGKEWRPDELGWLYWPKASEVILYGDDRFTINWGRWTITYRVLP